MAAANFEDVKRKYNFTQISVATWRDPSLSVHPARGGPDPFATIPAESAPYYPTYKVNYDPSDGDENDDDDTDDDPSDEDDIDEDLLERMLHSLTSISNTDQLQHSMTLCSSRQLKIQSTVTRTTLL